MIFISKTFSIYCALILLLIPSSSLLAQTNKFFIKKATKNPFQTNVFIENSGQFNNWINKNGNDILFAANSGGWIFFTSNSLVFRINELEKKESKGIKEEEKDLEDYYVQMEWFASNKNVNVEKSKKTSGYYTFGGEGFNKLQVNGYESIIYKELYKGIDVEYRIPSADSSGIKYNIVIHPNGNYQSIKMKYQGDIKKVSLNKENKIVIDGVVRQMIDQSPTAYYKEDGTPISVNFKIDNDGYVCFDFPNGIKKNRTIIIDPWIVIPSVLSSDNHVYDVDFDYNGDIYVSGGTFPYKFAKYDKNGNFLWTFTNSIFAEPWYSEFGLIRKSGSVYIPEGFGLPKVLKLNSAGLLLFDTIINSPNNEIWTIFYNPCNEKMLGFGGGTVGLKNLYLFNDTNLTSVSVINSNGANGTCCNDITDAIIDFNGDIYELSVSENGTSPSVSNHIFKNLQSNSYVAPPVFDINTGYSFDECGCLSSNFYGNGVANVLALNTSYLFSYNGNKIDVWDKINGNLLGSTIVDSTYTEGRDRNHQGITVDECNNVYVGGNQTIHVYYFDGNNFISINNISTNIPEEVYDIALDEGRGLLYVSGNGFISSISAIPCNAMSVTTSIDCFTSKITLDPQGGIPPYSYQWSNGSTSNNVTLSAGTYIFTIQDASCNKRTIIDSIVVSENSLMSPKVIVPNVFSPNSDGFNNLFKVDAVNISAIDIKIFNRWGKLLYMSNDNNGWDGTNEEGKNVSAGTYFYLIGVEIESCGVKQIYNYKGALTLLR